jgi:signal transduction histidine kinase
VKTIWAAGAAALGGALSLLVTGLWLSVGPRSEPHGAALVLWALEIVILLALIFVTSRTARSRLTTAAVVPAAVAVSVSLLRFGSLNWQVATGCCVWGLSAVVAALAGGYLRSLDTGRERAVEQARLQQRLELAGDLHDFVAHDVSEILAQAQAAQVLVASEPSRLPVALERISTAAVRALDTLDRTVHGDPGPVGSIDEIPLLVSRFQSVENVGVGLELRQEAVAALSQESGREVYRAVVEALTNVRRHAVEAQQVHIRLRSGPAAGRVELSITDDAPHDAAAAHAPARTGLGLTNLSARVQGLGGTTWAGPGEPAGWQLRVTLPEDAAKARGSRSR